MYDPDDPDLEGYDPIAEIDPMNAARHAYNEEQAMKKLLIVIKRRRIRDFADPFDVTFRTFVKSYRFGFQPCGSDTIRPHVRRTTSDLALPLELKVLAVLSFYAIGSYQTPTGKIFDICVAQPTMSKYIDEITTALNAPPVVARFIRFPETEDEIGFCVERNRMLGAKIDNTVGYIDGTLVKVRKPSVANNRQAFIGRKSYASVNVQITCDRRLFINNVLARFPGSTNDSFIFSASAVRRKMQQLHTMRRCHLLGDSGYALEPWLIVPFARDDRPQEDTPESRFNYAHCSDRNCVERCIGLLKELFRAIDDERVPHYDALSTCKFVVAITVIYNLRILTRIPHFQDINEADLRNGNILDDNEDHNENEEVANLLARGRAARQRIVEELEAARVRR